METNVLNRRIDSFDSRLTEMNMRVLNSRRKRIAMLNSLLSEVKQEADDVQPYLRVMVGYHFIENTVDLILFEGLEDYEEIAYYFTVIDSDIEYVAANDICGIASYHYIYHISALGTLRWVIHTLTHYCSVELVRRFMNSVVTIRCNENKFHTITSYFACLIEEYDAKGDYQSVIDYGVWYFELDEVRGVTIPPLVRLDLEYCIDSIIKTLGGAYEALGVRNEENEKAMIGVKEREEEPYREKLARKRRLLYHLADECMAHGDSEGYRGYMSAAGDVGR